MANIGVGVHLRLWQPLQSVREDGVAVLDEVFSSYSPAFSDNIATHSGITPLQPCV
jgi:hypothetical protein